MVAIQFRRPTSNKVKYSFMKPKKKIFKSRSRSVPTRKKVSTKRVTTIVKRELAKDLELKLNKLGSVYAGTPLNQDTTNNVVFYNNYCLGTPATTWQGPTGSANFVGLQGFTWPQGVSNNERIGKYMTLKQTSLSFRIGLVDVPRASNPQRFRVIVYKAKRNAILGAAGGNPNENLFIGLNGTELGINNTYAQNAVAYEMMTMLVNKRNYDVYHDSQFMLCHPTYSIQGGSNIVSPISQGYPNEKNFLWKLPHNQKSAFGVGNIPEDLRYQYCITVLSMPTGDLTGTGQNSWRTQVRGVTSALDA